MEGAALMSPLFCSKFSVVHLAATELSNHLFPWQLFLQRQQVFGY
uniref:Uncharacterized protein n=1 Tax=Rhizophora mucronata TaxID=61149 RepID=A0A2P2PTS8_RHIMU